MTPHVYNYRDIIRVRQDSFQVFYSSDYRNFATLCITLANEREIHFRPRSSLLPVLLAHHQYDDY